MATNTYQQTPLNPKIYEMVDGVIYSRTPGSITRTIEGYIKTDDISYGLNLWISLYHDSKHDARLAEEVEKLFNYYILCKK